MTKNLSRRIIHRLFDFSNSSHGISRVHALSLLFLFLAFPHTRAQPGSSTPNNPYGFRGNGVNPSMTVVIIILVCAFFFIGFFAVYLRHCTESRSSVAGVGIGRTVGGGLDPELIETFPIIVYSAVKNLKIGQVPLECAVCLNEFEDDESLRLLPKCDHVFHPECIDAWLVSHITCPVCRTNLTPVDGENEIVRNYESVLDSNESPSEQKPKSELSEERNHVSINITGDQTDEPRTNEISNINLTNLIQNRPPRSRSTTNGRFAGKFPRSHSTGHSLVQPGENLDRYTLRLPEEVRKQIAMTSKLNRAKSYGHGVVLAREGSSRKGNNRTGVEATSTSKGSNLDRGFGRFDRRSQSDRWMLTIAPPFLTRAGSVKSPKKGDNGGDVMAAEGGTAKTILTSVMGPLDCLAPKVDGAEVSTIRSQAVKDRS